MANKNNGSGPQIKRREKWLELPQEYEGFKVRVWLNAPAKLWTALTEQPPEWATAEESQPYEERRFAAITQLVLEHNGWLDYDGQPYPPASEVEFWELIPTELAACVLVALGVEQQELPKSLAPKSRRSRRG